MTAQKVTIAVHKFSSCDGCQLGFLNSVNAVLALSEWIEILHFAEAGPYNPEVDVDIAFVEGSISTPQDIERIQLIRQNSRRLISIGACATSGGIQALRNMASHDDYLKAIYAQPEYIRSLDTSTPIAEHVSVDDEIWGCPISSQQLLQHIQAWLQGGTAEIKMDSVCSECKQRGHSCVMVTQKRPCLGPITRAGCGAICPGYERDCYGCFGPSNHCNPKALAKQFEAMGLSNIDIANRFLGINNQAKAFNNIGRSYRHIDETQP